MFPTNLREVSRNRRPLELEQCSQPLGLHSAYWNFGVLLVVHAQLEAALEPRDHFLDAVDKEPGIPDAVPDRLRAFVRNVTGLTLSRPAYLLPGSVSL